MHHVCLIRHRPTFPQRAPAHGRARAVRTLLAALCLVTLMAACTDGQSGNEPASRNALLRPEALAFRTMTYGEFRESGGPEAEFYHGGFYLTSAVDLEAAVLFLGEYGTETNQYRLPDDARCLRLEGALGEFLPDAPVSREAFLQYLEERCPFSCTEAEGGGTAYYPADLFLMVECDTDGDGASDTCLEIPPDDSGEFADDVPCWVMWPDELADRTS